MKWWLYFTLIFGLSTNSIFAMDFQIETQSGVPVNSKLDYTLAEFSIALRTNNATKKTDLKKDSINQITACTNPSILESAAKSIENNSSLLNELGDTLKTKVIIKTNDKKKQFVIEKPVLKQIHMMNDILESVSDTNALKQIALDKKKFNDIQLMLPYLQITKKSLKEKIDSHDLDTLINLLNTTHYYDAPVLEKQLIKSFIGHILKNKNDQIFTKKILSIINQSGMPQNLKNDIAKKLELKMFPPGWYLDSTLKTIGKNLIILNKHNTFISSVAFSPDSKILAAADADKHTVYLYEMNQQEKEPKFLQKLTHHTNRITSISFSGCGTYLVSTSYDGLIHLYKINKTNKSATHITSINKHTTHCYTVALNPSGTLLASGDNHGIIHIHAIDKSNDTIKHLKQIQANSSPKSSICFSSDGNYCVSTGWDNTVYLYETKNFQTIATMNPSNKPALINVVAFSLCDNFVASGGSNLLLLDKKTNSLKNLIALNDHKKMVSSVAFHPNSNYFATCSTDGTICLYTLSKERNRIQLIKQFKPDKHFVNSLNFSPDGKYLAAGCHQKSVCLYDIEKLNILKKLNLEQLILFNTTQSVDDMNDFAFKDQTIQNKANALKKLTLEPQHGYRLPTLLLIGTTTSVVVFLIAKNYLKK